uniref:Sodium/calcium exchanger membrane region domain-containing protein n=1 Tax=Strongyloides stercoralis TaxID=6248 RepID=A0A0K0ELY2_STRER
MNLTDVTECSPPHNLNITELCNYVSNHDDVCEGGGFVLWSMWTLCQETLVKKYVVFAFSILCLGYLILILLTTADDYFSVNISQIVEHFKISQNIAGVTFMAFGNGAPDIFNSLASILSSKSPKAGLAIGELLGAIIFLSTIVAGSIGMVSNFTVMRRPFIRDILFFYPPFCLLLVSFLTTNFVHIWLPITFLIIYIIYAIIVILSQYIRKGMLKTIENVKSTKQSININVITLDNEENSNTSIYESHGPMITVASLEEPISRPHSASFSNYYNNTTSNNLKTPVLTRHNSINSLKERARSFIIDHSSLFVPNNNEEEEEEMVYVSRTRKSIFVHDARSRAESELTNNNAKIEKKKKMLTLNIIQKVWIDINPWDQEIFNEENIVGKIFFILKLPIFLVLNISCPLGDREWNKWLTLLHILLCPVIFLTAFQVSLIKPTNGGPSIGVYILIVSFLLTILGYFFTKENEEPRFYKTITIFTGFLMAISFIYTAATEIVGIAGTIGIITGLSHEVLGLTILAWSNSVGDLFSDMAVAKAGYPRMGISAAIGGPLFNILIGFGLPFTIGVIQGKNISLKFSTLTKILLIFVTSSLTFTLFFIPLRRFKIDKMWSICLYCLYVGFLIMAFLAEAKIISF